MIRNMTLAVLFFWFIFISLPCFTQDMPVRETSRFLADSPEQLDKFISSAVKEDDPKKLEFIITENSQLIRENKYLTFRVCNRCLDKAIEKELNNNTEPGNNYIKIIETAAKICEDTTDKFLLDKVAIFRTWSKEKKEKYQTARKWFLAGEEQQEGYKYSSANYSYDKSLKLYCEIGYKMGEADCLKRLGDMYHMSYEYRNARRKYRQGCEIYKEIKFPFGEADCLKSIGDVYKNRDEYREAGRKYEEALEIFKKVKSRLGEAHCLSSMGDLRWILAEYEAARKKFEQGLELYKKIKFRLGEANCLKRLGDVHKIMAEYDKARYRYEEGLKIYRNINSRLGEAKCLKSLGDVHWNLDDYKKAREQYTQGLGIFREIHYRYGEANSLQSLGDVHRMFGKYEEAKQRYKEGLRIYKEIRARLGEANSLRNLGDVYRITSENEKARKLYKKAISKQKKIGDRQGLLWSYFNLGLNFEVKKKYKRAEKYYKKSIHIIEEIWNQLKIAEHKELYFASNIKIYEGLIRVLFKQKKGNAAFRYAERSKARAFLYLLGNRRINPKKGVSLRLIRKEDELRNQINLVTLKIRENEKRKEYQRTLPQRLTAQLLSLKRQHSDIIQRIKRYCPEYSTFVTVNPLPVEEIQALIREERNMVIIEYYTTTEATYLWLLDGHRIHAHKINITKKELQNKIGEYHTMVSNPTFGVETLRGRAEELYRLLIEPVEPQIQKNTHIGVVPHGNLHYLSFESLMKSGEFLTELQYKTFYLPNCSTYIYCKEKNREKKETLTGWGNPDGTLIFSEMEIAELKRLYPDSTEIFTGENAKESSFKNTYAPLTDIIHFACHGSFNANRPMYSALHLAATPPIDDGNLEVHEIYQLQLKPAYLITLSACQTQVGSIQPGDEIIGLTRAFIYAGTSGILGSLWKVDDYYTEKFMTTFYSALKDSDKIDALHKARQTMIDTYKKKHPYYWSAFVLVGDPR